MLVSFSDELNVLRLNHLKWLNNFSPNFCVTRFGQSDGKTPAGIFILITYPGLHSRGPPHICMHSELLNSQNILLEFHFPGWSLQE